MRNSDGWFKDATSVIEKHANEAVKTPPMTVEIAYHLGLAIEHGGNEGGPEDLWFKKLMEDPAYKQFSDEMKEAWERNS